MIESDGASIERTVVVLLTDCRAATLAGALRRADRANILEDKGTTGQTSRCSRHRESLAVVSVDSGEGRGRRGGFGSFEVQG